MSQNTYYIRTDLLEINWMDTELTFLINRVRSREPSVLYSKFHFYDKNKGLIKTITNERWVIDYEYSSVHTTFEVDETVLHKSYYYQIELTALGNSSENPLFMQGLMLKTGELESDGYHKPSDITENLVVKFINNKYVNLYNNRNDDSYLQVIRPTGTEFTTSLLTESECTVLAPHFEDEPSTDSPINVFLEYINQTEQRIDVLR